MNGPILWPVCLDLSGWGNKTLVSGHHDIVPLFTLLHVSADADVLEEKTHPM